MMIKAWRVVKAKFKEVAFNGDGSAKYGGRWNSIGTPVVYVAESLSLATLEILVGGYPLGSFCGYVKYEVNFDASLVETVPARVLPKAWASYPPDEGCRKIGDKWAKEMRSVILKVPSAVIQEESNFLINPVHPDFKRLIVGAPRELTIDKRLLRG